MTDEPRTIADRYTIVRRLGRGGFATTWLCRAREVREGEPGKLVALKELRVGRTDEPEPEAGDSSNDNPGWKHVELFEREAKVLAMLRHPGVPRVIEYFEHPREAGGLGLYLVQEYVDAPSLRERIEKGPLLGADELERLVHGLLDVLEYMHGRAPPVFHRDIKPSNILVRDDGQPILIDFGGVCFGWRPPTQVGTTVVGTFGYMPPEQLLGHVGATTDLYALGATLLELVSGMPPHEFPWDTGRIEVPDDLPADPRLVRLIRALLEPAPRQRPASPAAARAIYVDTPTPAVSKALVAPRVANAIAVMGGDGPRYVDLGPPPRTLDGPFADVYLDLVDPFAMYRVVRNPLSRALVMIGYGVISIGILPIWYWVDRNQRKTRYTRLFLEGHATLGRVLAVTVEEGGVAANVKYGYEADAVEYRGFMNLPIKLARYWGDGDPVTVLYDPADPTESCFVFRRVQRG
ncbi:serine/threonine-protein kinase [Nannocystaceae bacterium ST9]